METTAAWLRLAEPLRALFANVEPLPAWYGGDGAPAIAFAELLHRIGLLAIDAGIAHAAEVDAETLRQTYLIYLVRQGARLTELEQIAGPMAAAELQRYAAYAPGGGSRPLAQLDLCYPALA